MQSAFSLLFTSLVGMYKLESGARNHLMAFQAEGMDRGAQHVQGMHEKSNVSVIDSKQHYTVRASNPSLSPLTSGNVTAPIRPRSY